MPAHVKAMLTGVSLHVPVIDGSSRSGPGRASISPSTATRRTGARSCSSSSAAEPNAGVTARRRGSHLRQSKSGVRYSMAVDGSCDRRRGRGYGFLRPIPASQRHQRSRSRLAPSSTSRRIWLAEACVRDYSRLRAGDGADALFADAAFAAILDQARWDAYPRALAMVGEMARGNASPACWRGRASCAGAADGARARSIRPPRGAGVDW